MSARGCGVSDDRYMRFPVGFFDRSDDSPDDRFYGPERLVTHIDDVAIAAVGALYRELGLTGDVLDLMSSWISHFLDRPRRLTVLGMNGRELAANPMADERIVADLNTQPVLGFEDQSFDAAVCCVSVDYLVRPLELFDEVARVLRPGGAFVCTFSNRCFPTKAIRGWLASTDEQHCEIVAAYFRLARNGVGTAAFGEPQIERRTPAGRPGDPLYAVWARRRAS